MQADQFQVYLASVKALSPEQRQQLCNTLSHYSLSSPSEAQCQLLERIKSYFDQHPQCPRCHSDSMIRWGQSSGHQRYRCNDCKHTCNALSFTPLAHLRVRDKLDAYLSCMSGGVTLRPAAAECEISLNTSFHLRHRLMAVIEQDSTGQLSGICEMDETFFRESRKGERGLGDSARKRGGRCSRKGESGKKPKEKVKLIPVMVACDRQRHIKDAVLQHVSADELSTQLTGQIQEGSTLCTDALYVP